MTGAPTALAVGSYTAASGGRGAGVTLLERDPRTGRLGAAGNADDCASPSFLAAAGPGGTLHAAHELESGRVSTRRFDGTRWELLGEVDSGGSSPCQIAVHPGGELLVVANYGGGLGVVAAPGGVVTELLQSLSAHGAGPVAERQGSSHPHSATFPDAGHVVVCDLGTDERRVHTAGPAGLSPEPVQVVAVAPGTGPRHARLRGGRLHVVGELDPTVTSYAVTGGRLLDPVTQPALLARSGVPVFPSEITTAAWGLVVANRGADVITLHDVVDGVARPVRDVGIGARNPRHVVVVERHV